MSEPTTERINEALARVEDYYLISSDDGAVFALRHGRNTNRWPWRESATEVWLLDAPPYTESLDACRGVMGKLDERQRNQVWWKLELMARESSAIYEVIESNP